MTRALWLFALFVAFVVTGARCLGSFPVAAVGSSASGVPVSQALRQGPQAPQEQDPTTGASIDGDSDDGVDALLAPSSALFALVAAPVGGAAIAGALCEQLALRSHAQGLERPPRV